MNDYELRDCELLVIGGGPAGMAAALSARDSGIERILLVERAEVLGGILNQCLHSGFGLTYFQEELNGPAYAARFQERIEKSDIRVLTSTMALNLEKNGNVLLSGEKCGLIKVAAQAVILASGCRERPIGTLPVTGTRPAGIFTAGMAQKMINLGGYDIGSRIVILGSGDVGMIVARRLAILGKQVIAVLEKEAVCGGLPRNRIQCLEHYQIPLQTNCTVSRIHGKGRIAGVTVLDLQSHKESFLACDTLITSLGLIPERELAEEVADGQKLPDWLFLCGNACYVHDLVDDVTLEAEQVGRAAASYIRVTSEKNNLHLPAFRDKQTEAGTKQVPKEKADAFCIACPKGCALLRTENGWEGAICGRKDPLVSHP